MRMFLTGEGPTDCGREQFDRRTAQNIWQDGPVQIYIRKINPTIQIDTYGKHRLRDASSTRKTRRNQRSIRGLEGHGEKAFFVAQLATEMGYDIAAMYVDADKSSGSTQKDSASCQKRYDLVKGQVLTGLQRGGAARPVAIVPVKMIECWILGDRNAFVDVFGMAPDHKLFRNPELLWGNEYDSNSDYPKNYLSRILETCGVHSSQAIFVSIADASAIETLCKTCPISFADFAAQLSTYT